MLLLFNINFYSQIKTIESIIFNNNRVCIGFENKINKHFSFNIDGGILGKDYFTRSRSILLHRIINSKQGSANPYYYVKNQSCKNQLDEGYQIQINGIKFAFNYYSNQIINSRKNNIFRLNFFLGFFYGVAKIKPLNFIIKSSTPQEVEECSESFSLTGIFGGVGLNYFFKIKNMKKFTFGVGLSSPFYKPRSPYWYSDSGITPLMSGLEPEIKLLITKVKYK